MTFKKICPTCQSRSIFVYNCHDCGKVCCDACMITCFCIDCYTTNQNKAEIKQYNKEKYVGVPNEL